MAGGCVAVMCGKKKEAEVKPIAMLGSDTLTAEQLLTVCPDTAASPMKIRRIMLQVSLAKKAPAPDDTARFYKAVDEIAEQMSLRSDQHPEARLLSVAAPDQLQP